MCENTFFRGIFIRIWDLKRWDYGDIVKERSGG